MKPGKAIVLSLTALFAAVLWSDSAFAHGRRHHHHRHHHNHHHHDHHGLRIVFYAAPLVVPRYVPTPVYYAPPPAPPVYIEQPQQGYWHYCPAFGAYYPQVRSCPGGWQLVAPQPR